MQHQTGRSLWHPALIAHMCKSECSLTTAADAINPGAMTVIIRGQITFMHN